MEGVLTIRPAGLDAPPERLHCTRGGEQGPILDAPRSSSPAGPGRVSSYVIHAILEVVNSPWGIDGYILLVYIQGMDKTTGVYMKLPTALLAQFDRAARKAHRSRTAQVVILMEQMVTAMDRLPAPAQERPVNGDGQ